MRAVRFKKERGRLPSMSSAAIDTIRRLRHFSLVFAQKFRLNNLSQQIQSVDATIAPVDSYFFFFGSKSTEYTIGA